jgi:hypothetical protein
MLLNGKPVKDSSPYHEYYIGKGLSTDLLAKCNMQTFKFIGGYGEGYFISDNVQYITGETVNLTIPGVAYSVKIYIIDVTEIEHPNATKKTRILHTGEEKFGLTEATIQRNYNVINRRTQFANTAAIIPPDDTPLTLQQILQDIIPGLLYFGPAATPYDVFIQGMNVVEAVDKLCSAYGLVWTYQSNTARVYSLIVPASDDFNKMEDIQNQVIPDPYTSITTIYPILDCCQQYPNDFDYRDWYAGNEGDSLQVYMPYFPAIYDQDGFVTNAAALNSLAAGLRPFYQAADRICGDYISYPFYKNFDLTAKPTTSKVSYADLGSGPRTFLSGEPYPYLKKPTITKPLDRQCKEWIGYLYQEYKGILSGFWVVPAYGLDGLVPDNDAFEGVYVINLFKWNYGQAGAMVYVKWDCVNYRWIAIQQEYVCPPSTTPAAPDPPPPPPSYGELAGMP